jgi:hypothetical protein
VKDDHQGPVPIMVPNVEENEMPAVDRNLGS